jgi:DNA polymerase-3 subunit gamma/tau
MDAASHTGIDNIRDIIESVQYAPAMARYKVYIIDEVHQLSNHSFNALLKTLEEPPAHLKFIFATTEIRKVPVTVLSRCQRFDLRRVDAGVLAEHLKRIIASEGVEADDDALALVARAAEGSVRDALSILDQAIAHAAGKLEAASLRAMLGLADRARIIDLFEHVMKGDVAAALGELKEQYDLGADPSVVMTDLADFVHYVTRLKYVPQATDDASLSEAERSRGADFARDLSVRVLGRAWQILVKGIAEIEASERPLPAADMVLVRLTHAASLPAPDELLRSLEEGGPRPAAPASALSGNGGGNGNARAAPVSASSGMSMPSGDAPRASGAPTAMTARQTEPLPAETPETLTLASFEDLILLCEDKRDIRLRTSLKRHVRLINFADGKLQFEIAGNPPPNFIQDLSAKLLTWTGKRWMIATSKEGGRQTIEEAEQAEANERAEQARSNPAVDAIMTRFPGARIIDVKMRQPELQPDLEAPEDPDGEAIAEPGDETGLDDFFD